MHNVYRHNHQNSPDFCWRNFWGRKSCCVSIKHFRHCISSSCIAKMCAYGWNISLLFSWMSGVSWSWLALSGICFSHPSGNLRNELKVQITPPKDLQVDLHIKAFVGNKTRSVPSRDHHITVWNELNLTILEFYAISKYGKTTAALCCVLLAVPR